MYHSIRISSIRSFLLSFSLLPLLRGPMFIHSPSFEAQHAQQIIATIINQKQWHHQNRPPKTQEEARTSNNCLMTDFFKRGRPGSPKKRATLTSDELDVRRAPPPPSQSKSTKKSKTDNAASAATTAKPLGVVPRKNYYVGDDKVNLDNAVSEWSSGSFFKIAMGKVRV